MATATAVAATAPPDDRTAGAAPVSVPPPSELALTVGADEAPGKGAAPPPSGAEEAVDGAPVMATSREPSAAVGEAWSVETAGKGDMIGGGRIDERRCLCACV